MYPVWEVPYLTSGIVIWYAIAEQMGEDQHRIAGDMDSRICRVGGDNFCGELGVHDEPGGSIILLDSKLYRILLTAMIEREIRT